MKDKNLNENLDNLNKPFIWWKTTNYHCVYGTIKPSIYTKNLFYIYSVHDEYMGERKSLNSAKNFLQEVFQSGKKYWCPECQDFKNDGDTCDDNTFHHTCLDCKWSDLVLLEM